jgi:vancomycin permeability regulator SanA
MRAAVGRKLKHTLWFAGTLAVLALAALAGTNAWIDRASRGRVYSSTASVPSRNIAIVPGARVVGGKPFVHLEGRLQVALSLYQTGRVKAILVSGNQTDESPEVAAMTTWLLKRGVAAKDILADDLGTRTRETMERAAGVYDVHDAVICTQDVTVARSLYLATEAGIDAVAVGVPSTLAQSARYMRNEALKTTLSFVESLFAYRPPATADEASVVARADRRP